MKTKLLLPALLLIFLYSSAKTWQVGSGKTYTLPSQVAGLVADGDTVDIDAGQYVDCATWSKKKLLLRGVGGYAHVKDKVCGSKAIWIITGDSVTVERIEFSGAAIGSNAAGIRQEGLNGFVRNCYFHDNENGILYSTIATGNMLVEYSEFGNNGLGDGYTHNIYVSNCASFTLRYCYMHHAKIGHEVKSRAHKNYILYNRIMDEVTGDASRNIDLPNGGLAIIIGNLIEQGPNSGNSNIIGFGLEGLTNTAPHDVYVINNTIVNDKTSGSFVQVQSGTNILKMVNNIFAGTGTVISGTPSTLDSTTNWIVANKTAAGLVNVAGYDYQLLSSSPAINKGSDPGSAGTYPLAPVYEYVHNSSMRARNKSGNHDIGAYEYNPSTGLRKLNELSLKIYPNPVSENLTVEIAVAGESELALFNPMGMRVYAEKISVGKIVTIETDHLVRGMYLLVIISGNNIVSKKIILQ